MKYSFQAEWIIPDSRPPDDWPSAGNIAVEEFDLKYREGLPLVLKQINCDIKSGEKVPLHSPRVFFVDVSTHEHCF